MDENTKLIISTMQNEMEKTVSSEILKEPYQQVAYVEQTANRLLMIPEQNVREGFTKTLQQYYHDKGELTKRIIDLRKQMEGVNQEIISNARALSEMIQGLLKDDVSERS